MVKNKILLFILLFLIPIGSAYSEKKTYTLEVKRQGKDRYYFDFSLKSTLPPEELINICYDSKQINQYINPIIKVHDINASPSSRKLQYTVRVLFYKSVTNYTFVKNPGGLSIDFHISHFKQNIKMIPEIVESKGIIEVTDRGGKNSIRYYQFIKLDKKISNRYLSFSRMQTESYFKRLTRYIKKLEAQSVQQTQ